jgi:hypothetical protein
VKANGQVVETRRLQPAGDGAPIEATFTVSLIRTRRRYTPGSMASDSSSRTTTVARCSLGPAGGSDGSWPSKAHPATSTASWARDQRIVARPDAVVRKGKNDNGQETFFVRRWCRAPALAQGLPSARDVLFSYDAVIIANVEGNSSRARSSDAGGVCRRTGRRAAQMGARVRPAAI